MAFCTSCCTQDAIAKSVMLIVEFSPILDEFQIGVTYHKLDRVGGIDGQNDVPIVGVDVRKFVST